MEQTELFSKYFIAEALSREEKNFQTNKGSSSEDIVGKAELHCAEDRRMRSQCDFLTS